MHPQFYLMETQQKEIELLIASTALFMKYGIKSLTMDDISRHLGISKKTLYLFVTDKKDLVKKGMKLMVDEEKEMMLEVIKNSNTAIDELMGITRCVSTKLGEIHPSVIFDLQKYHPQAWKIMEDHKMNFIYEMMLENLKRGIKEGYYRENINPLIIANIYMGMVDNMLNPENPVSKTTSIDKLHIEIIRYHIKGIANENGIAVLKEALKNEENNHLSID